MVLDIGDSAPDFELTDPDMKMRTLGEFKGKKVVLSFIVAASSPVCEAELCTFRDSWNDISNLGAQVIAISNDGPFANKAFAEKHNFWHYSIQMDFRRSIKRTKLSGNYGFSQKGKLVLFNLSQNIIFVNRYSFLNF